MFLVLQGLLQAENDLEKSEIMHCGKKSLGHKEKLAILISLHMQIWGDICVTTLKNGPNLFKSQKTDGRTRFYVPYFSI